MAVGAQDVLDKKLVMKYASKQVENHDDIVSKMIDPNKMMETMNDVAEVQRSMLAMSNKLASICAQINSKARYKSGQKFFRSFNG